MLPAATSPAPRLTPDDTLLLEAFLACRRSLFALARHTSRPADALFAWFDQPHIQHALAILNTKEEHDHRSAARDHLRQVADAADNPTERRRAATSLLYSLSLPARTRGTEAADAAPCEPASRPAAVHDRSESSSADPRHSETRGTPCARAPSLESVPPARVRSGSSGRLASISVTKPASLDPDTPAATPHDASADTLLDRAFDEHLDRETDDEDDQDADEFAHLTTEELIAAAKVAADQLRAEYRDLLALESAPPNLREVLPSHPAGP